LRVGGHTARVVVTDHHDQPWTHDGEERDESAAQPRTLLVADPDPAERPLDITEVSLVKNSARRG
jgi:hypothetical protein